MEAAPRPDNELPNAFWNVVTPGYFRTLGVPLRAGRGLTPADDASSPPVALVNETLARRLLPGGDAVGARIRTGLDGEEWVTVVGVVGNTLDRGLTAPPEPMLFRPLAQPTRFGIDHLRVVLRTAGDPSSLVGPTREAIWSVRGDVPLDEARTLRELLYGAAASRPCCWR